MMRLFAATLVTLLLVPQLASAAPKPTNGISLSPFQKEIVLGQSGGDQSYELRLSNNSASVQEVGLSGRDFGSLNDTGGLLLDGATGRDYSKKYGLASWISLSADTAVLEPGESRQIGVTIQNRSDLQPGGHYGAVVATVNSLYDRSGDRVLVNQQLLSLILVKKTGGEHYSLALKQISHDGNWVHLPNTVTLRVQNSGNVHVVPRGIVRLKSPSGAVIKTGIINAESATVLPEAYRQLYVPLTRVGGAAPVPGPYKIEVEYRYDGITKIATKSQFLQFVSLPSLLGLGLVLGVTVAIYRRRKKFTTKTK